MRRKRQCAEIIAEATSGKPELSAQSIHQVHEARDTARPPELGSNTRAQLENEWTGREASPRSPVDRTQAFEDNHLEQFSGNYLVKGR